MIKITFKTALIMSCLSQSLLAENKHTVEQLFSVQVVKVKQVSQAKSKKNFGFVKVDQSRVYDVTPRFSGYVVELYADKIYQKVKKGDPLVKVYSPDVLKAKDEYINSYKFASSKQNKGMLDSAKRKLELLNIDQREIRHLMKNRVSIATSTIYAPEDGYIFTKNISKGSAFNAKQKLFTIANLDNVWVEVKLDQNELSHVSQVDHYEVSTQGSQEIFSSKKSLLYPMLDKKEALMTLRVDISNKKNILLPGMYANIKSVSLIRSQLTLPVTAVIRKNNRYYAFSVGEYEGEYEPVEVKVTPFDNDTYIIHEGLSAGDEVVNNALFMIDSDAQINALY